MNKDPLPRAQAAALAAAALEPGMRVCAYAQLTFLCEETLQLFVENPAEAYDVLRSPCSRRAFFDTT